MKVFFVTLLYALLAVIFGFVMMALLTMLTGDIYGALMGAIFAAGIVTLLEKV